MKSSFCRHTMVSGWLHQARLIGKSSALVYFVIMRIGYNADFGMDPKFRVIQGCNV